MAYLTADTGTVVHKVSMQCLGCAYGLCNSHDSSGCTLLLQLVSDSEYRLLPSKHVTCMQDPKYVTSMQDAMLDHACHAQRYMC